MTGPTATDDEVTAAYRLLLDREPAPADVAEKAGMRGTDLLRALLFSDEFVARRLYYLREMLLTGFTDHAARWFERYRALLMRFRQGHTFSADSSDHAEFLLVTYLVMLRRIPDPFGFFEYIRQLEDGTLARAAVIRGIADSTEARAKAHPVWFFDDPESASAALEEVVLPDPDRDPVFGAGDGSGKLLILSGPPRSGTTVLAAMLNAHPRICMTFESRIFALADQLTRSLLVLSPARSGVFDTVFDVAEQCVPAAVRRHLGSLRKISIAIDRPRRQVHRIVRKDAPPLFVGDKNPAYIAEASWTPATMLRDFPDARWILIFRNPDEVCRSQIRRGVVAGKQDVCIGLRACFENALLAKRTLGPEQCFITTHDRVFAPATYRQEVARLASFLDLPDHDAFSGFVARQIREPEKFSAAERTAPTPTTMREVDAFFADQPDAAVFNRLARELGLWPDAPPNRAGA